MEILDLTEAGARLVVANKRHARELARIMREADRKEVKASGGWAASEAVVRSSMNRSKECYAAFVGDDLLCVFGVTVYSQFQAVWMLTSKHVERHPKVFWRSSKIVIEYLRRKYPLMMNMIHGQYTSALRWAERLGFTLSPPEKFGVSGDLFCRATMVTQRVILSPSEYNSPLLEVPRV